MKRDDLVQRLQTLLQCEQFRDYAPNGLQVEGKGEIRRLMTAVSASQAAVDAAAAWGADALLVHHGYFWKGEAPQITGIKRRRLKTLLTHDINLLAYHLPLDQHPDWGNNVLLGRALGAQNIRQSPQEKLLWHGEIAPQPLSALENRITEKLCRPPQRAGENHGEIRRIAWCTGAAQDLLALAAEEGAEVFLSGEYAERTWHEAREYATVYLSCGHHATERFGVAALAEVLLQEGVQETRFFDEDNPF